MTTSLEKRGIIPLLLGLASLVLIVAGLRAVSDLMSPILLSLFVAMVKTLLLEPFPETQLLAQLMGSGSPNESLAPATAENDEALTG